MLASQIEEGKHEYDFDEENDIVIEQDDLKWVVEGLSDDVKQLLDHLEKLILDPENHFKTWSLNDYKGILSHSLLNELKQLCR